MQVYGKVLTKRYYTSSLGVASHNDSDNVPRKREKEREEGQVGELATDRGVGCLRSHKRVVLLLPFYFSRAKSFLLRFVL